MSGSNRQEPATMPDALALLRLHADTPKPIAKIAERALDILRDLQARKLAAQPCDLDLDHDAHELRAVLVLLLLAARDPWLGMHAVPEGGGVVTLAIDVPEELLAWLEAFKIETVYTPESEATP